MLGSLCLLTHRIGLLQEGFGFAIAGALGQIPAGLLQQCGGFWSLYAVALQQPGAGLRMYNYPLPLRPAAMLDCRQRGAHGVYRALRPLPLCMLIHPILDHGLDESVDGERFHFGITLHEREFLQRFDGGIQLVWISSNRLKDGAELRRALADDFLRDGIWCEESTQV